MYEKPHRRRWDFYDKILIYVAGLIITSMVSFISWNVNRFIITVETLQLNQIVISEHQKNSDEMIKKLENMIETMKHKCC